MEHLDALARVVEDVVAPNAAEVDRTGQYPRANLEALGAAGILGLCSSTDVGGGGAGLDAAAAVVEELSRHCGSTAMIVMMHYSGTAVLEQHGPEATRAAIATGRHVTTLAFSEVGSRSHFWAPLGTATRADGGVRLDGRKSWVTSAGEADSYVWSSLPLAADGPMTLWLVDARAAGLTVGAPFDGMGLRGNASSPVAGEGVVVGEDATLGADGTGLDVALSVVLPWFLVLNAAASVGLMRAATEETRAHLGATRLEHLDQTLAQQAEPRTTLARMQIETDRTAAFVADTLAALGAGREDATLRVLEVKAAAAESVIDVTDLAMVACGGAAFRKELGVERRFRDARAARVMAPTTQALHDIVGRALLGLPLLGDVSEPSATESPGGGERGPSGPARSAESGDDVTTSDTLMMGAVAYDPKVVTIWDGFKAWFAARDFAFDYVLYSNYERQVEELAAGRIDAAWNSPLAWVRAVRLGDHTGRRVEALTMRDTDCDLTSVVVVRADSGIESVEQLRGRTVATGAVDSPQATLLPLSHLRAAGLDPGRDFSVRRFDVGVGLHGDHIGGEREAARALVGGEVDAACMIDGNHLAFSNDGTIPAGATHIVAQTDRYDHCNMTVAAGAPARVAEFGRLLLAMSYSDPEVRPLLDLEGLKEWRPGRTSGYAALARAVDETGFYGPEGDVTAGDYRP